MIKNIENLALKHWKCNLKPGEFVGVANYPGYTGFEGDSFGGDIPGHSVSKIEYYGK